MLFSNVGRKLRASGKVVTQYVSYVVRSRCGFCGIMVFVCSDIGGRSGNPTRFLNFRWMGIKLELPHLLKKHIYIYQIA